VADAPGLPNPLKAVLDRLEIPDTIRSELEANLTTGSSITIADLSHGLETGKGTDFITLTRDGPI
jgi:hypothetical protein